MRYSIELKDRVYVKGYGFLSFAKNISKNLTNKYSQNVLDTAKNTMTDTIKTASKRAIQRTAEAAGDLIGNKIADKITGRTGPKEVKALKKSNKELPNEEDAEITTHKKRYISPEERQKIIDELRLIPKEDAHF